MQGRLENELKIQRAAERVVAGLPSFVNEWYINMKASRKTASSCHEYVIKIRKFLEYINENPIEIDPSDITLQVCESYMISCQTKKDKNGMMALTSDSYQISTWFALNNLMKFLVNRKYIDENPMKFISKPKNMDLDRIKNERIQVTQNDFNKMLKVASEGRDYKDGIFNNRDVLILLVFMTTGIKESALLGINVEDIDTENKLLTVIDKGNKRHVYPLNDSTIKYFKLWLKDRQTIIPNGETNALFISRNNKRITREAVLHIVQKYSQQALGVRLSPHKLRAGFCSILYDKTHNIEFVRRTVGHSSISTTQRYIKTDDNEREEAIKIMTNILKI